MLFLAVKTATGGEIQYEGYARQRLPEFGEWELVQFGKYNGDAVILMGIWACHSETSSVWDAKYVAFEAPITLHPGENLNIHVKGFVCNA